jgi:hypothetical protein
MRHQQSEAHMQFTVVATTMEKQSLLLLLL